MAIRKLNLEKSNSGKLKQKKMRLKKEIANVTANISKKYNLDFNTVKKMSINSVPSEVASQYNNPELGKDIARLQELKLSRLSYT